MNQKSTKRKQIKCLVPSCLYNKPGTKASVIFSVNWHEVTGETKLFYNPIIQKQYINNMDQFKLMICDTHFVYHELIKDLETHIEKAPINSELNDLTKNATEEILKNYEILIVLGSIFDPLVARLSKLMKNGKRLLEDEVDFVINLLSLLKLFARSLDNRKSLLEMGLADVLVSYIEDNKLKSSKDDEKKVMIISLCIFLLNGFCVVEEDKLGELLDRTQNATWDYLSMDIPELQHQTLAFLWVVLNNKDPKYRSKLRGDIMFLIRIFNESKDNWSLQTLELFIAFFASVLFNQEKRLSEAVQENEDLEVKECFEYLDDRRIGFSDTGKYFTDRVLNILQPILVRKEVKEEEPTTE